MPIRVVHDHPVRYRWRRVRRRLALVTGVVLVVVGLLAGALPVLFAVVAAASLVTEGAPPELDSESTSTLVVLVVVAVLGIGGGVRLARGRRSVVLFLRRFRLLAPTEALSYAAAHAIGRRWRVVTLDDADVAPLGAARGYRRYSGLGVVAAVVLVAASLLWAFGGGLAGYLSGLEVDTPEPASIGAAIGAVIGTFVLLVVVGGLVLGLVLGLAAFFGLVGVFSWSARRAARRAERSKAGVLRERSDIVPYTRRLLRATQRIVGPRLVVVRAAPHVWRDAVVHLAGVCQVVVVDVSDPTESLVWETETLQRLRRPVVLVGESTRLGALAAPTTPRPDVQARLVDVLGDADVLAYEQDPVAVRRFARALRAVLEDVAA